ncbi:MAG TPA: peptidoglycan DD-metalloendopeptidase family protein [Verrucomicrobiae bacterium]|nr:peptidoglycan DD-metalloendopeptidase family protein [Verrucomicrobiae bacterium]
MKKYAAILLSFVLVTQPLAVFAQSVTDQSTASDVEADSLKAEVDDLNSQVDDKQKDVKDLESVIAGYKTQIDKQIAAQDSLQNTLALLDNQIKEKELTVEQTRAQIDIANLELQRVNAQIQLTQKELADRQDALGGIILELQDAGNVGDLEAFLARPSLSDFFSRVDELKRVEGDLSDATDDVKASKADLEGKQHDLEEYRTALQNQTTDLQKEQDQLEQDRSAKVSLLAETAQQEGQYQRLLYELRQQKQEESNDIADLETKLKDKLDSIDQALARGDILLNWPIKVTRISTYFHDPTYPFRNLFEHPGVDLPTDVGTPVHAAAGGYVAFTKRGSQYGNYIMVVHPGGVATIYAHLSKFNVQADTYVERGDVIGYSGGRPGDPGAGLSTGPHLHFEVRQDGIPVDPLPFLPSLN